MAKSVDPYINVNQAVVRKGDVDVDGTNDVSSSAKKVEGRLTAKTDEAASESIEGKVAVVHRDESPAVSLNEGAKTKLQAKVTTSKGQVSTPQEVGAGGEAPKPSATKGEWVDFAVAKGESRDGAEAMTKDELVDKYGE